MRRIEQNQRNQRKTAEAHEDLPSFGARVIAIIPLLLPLLWIYEWIQILQYMVFIILGVSGGGEEL